MVNAMATAAATASTMSIGTLMDASSVLAGGVITTGLDATGDGVGAAVGRAAAGAAARGAAGAAARGAAGLADGGEEGLSVGCAGV